MNRTPLAFSIDSDQDRNHFNAIRIHLLTVMRIRHFILMRLRIPLLSKWCKSAVDGIQILKGSIFEPPRLQCERPLPSATPFELLNCDSDSDPDSAFQNNSDPSGSTLFIVRRSVADPGCLSRIQFFPSRIRIFPSRIHIKEFKYFNPKNFFLNSEIWSGLFIPDPGWGQKGTGSRIPDPQHWYAGESDLLYALSLQYSLCRCDWSDAGVSRWRASCPPTSTSRTSWGWRASRRATTPGPSSATGSVPDPNPDPPDPHDFGPPRSVSGSTSQEVWIQIRIRLRTFNHQAKIVRKPWFLLFCDFFWTLCFVNVRSKSSKQKNFFILLVFSWCLEDQWWK